MKRTSGRPLLTVAARILLAGLLLAAAAHGQPGRKPPADLTYREDQLPPVDPAWKSNGWRAVVPHAYVLRRLVAARVRPEPAAPISFWLKGGVRVPVLEQARKWWRVGWLEGRSGWIPTVDLEPHAAFVLIDAATGRVERRLAAKGQWGPVADGRDLWSLSNTGLTRTTLGLRPQFWSYPVNESRDGILPEQSVWTGDRARFAMFVTGEPQNRMALTEATTGTVRITPAPDSSELVHVDAAGRVLVYRHVNREGKNEPPRLILYDPARSQEVGRVEGEVAAASRSGATFLHLRAAGTLRRFEADLKPGPSYRLAADLLGAAVSPDGSTLAVSYENGRADFLDARTLRRLARVRFHSESILPTIRAVFAGQDGWTALAIGEGESGSFLQRFDRRGRRVRRLNLEDAWTLSRAGEFYLARERDILVVNALTGATRTIPMSWRRPLPAAYLPAPAEEGVVTRLVVSALTLTPDGKTLVLTEWLSGDPQG